MRPEAPGEQPVAVRVVQDVPGTAAGLFVDPDPGPVLANFGVDNLRFLTPVKFDDELTVTLTCKQITPRDTADYGEVRWDTDVTRQDGESVARYDVLTLVAKQETAQKETAQQETAQKETAK